ncbi:MAG: isoprenoid biosynthesis glyoxalase ElbB [Bacteroidales bacterium]|nr:isoprenoid biosynthesis glyoxalase ElbB [Lentimicrobiaceae bacterium]MDD5694757.1 isoprenoid biosynthesis glyoxalase ElbB [Bacteroidales bacterium]
MKRFAIILAGCGSKDGSEIHEATMTMLAIQKNGAMYEIFAPDLPQHHVVNHITNQEMREARNILVESARIARGNIKALSRFRAEDFDALIIPGGYGVAKNLCDFAFKGDACSVNPEVEKAMKAMAEKGKPIGALCIAPVLLAKVFGDAEITIGQDRVTATAVEKMGARHITTGHGEVVIDRKRKLFTTPCYMLDASIVNIWEGADAIVKSMLKSM